MRQVNLPTSTRILFIGVAAVLLTSLTPLPGFAQNARTPAANVALTRVASAGAIRWDLEEDNFVFNRRGIKFGSCGWVGRRYLDQRGNLVTRRVRECN
jgi:hypothetical protein